MWGVVANRCVRCMQWLCCVFVFGDMDSCQDVPQYKVMKYLVFGIILSSLLSDYEKLRVRLVNDPNSLKFEFCCWVVNQCMFKGVISG